MDNWRVRNYFETLTFPQGHTTYYDADVGMYMQPYSISIHFKNTQTRHDRGRLCLLLGVCQHNYGTIANHVTYA